MKGSCVLALIALLVPAAAQDSANDDPLRLVVPMPETVAALWRPDEARAYAYAGGVRVAQADSVTTAAVFGNRKRDAVDEVLVLGGPHARWARRQADGSWDWDQTGWVVAGLAPDPFSHSYVDILGPLDGQLPAESGGYPTYGTDHVDEHGAFTIGVPAPGRWEVILDADTGPARGLAICTASSEKAVDPAQLPRVDVHSWRGELALDYAESVPAVPNPLGVSILVLSGAETMTESWGLGMSEPPRTLPLPPQVLAGRGWVWQPGWKCFAVEGAALRGDELLHVTVEAGHSLVVRVLDAAGKPARAAAVRLRNARNEVVPLPWGEVGDEAHAQISAAGSTGADGSAAAFGLGAGLVLQVEVTPALGGAPVTVPWDGQVQIVDVTLG